MFLNQKDHELAILSNTNLIQTQRYQAKKAFGKRQFNFNFSSTAIKTFRRF